MMRTIERRWFGRIVAGSFVGVLLLASAACDSVQEPAAIVNGQRISFEDVEARAEEQGLGDQTQNTDAMAFVLNTMVREVLVRDELERLGVEMSDADRTDAARLLEGQATGSQFEALIEPQAELIALSYALSGGRPAGDVTSAFLAEHGDDVVCATVVQTIDRPTADTTLQQLRDGADPSTLAEQSPESVVTGAGCGVVGTGTVPEAFEAALVAAEIGDITDVIEVGEGGQTSYSILIRVVPTRQNAAGLAEQDAMTKATSALTGFLAKATVTVSTRIGRWGEDADGTVYGPGVYGVIPNTPPTVEARPAAPTTTLSVLEQLTRQ